jgi:hypothetical protein
MASISIVDSISVAASMIAGLDANDTRCTILAEAKQTTQVMRTTGFRQKRESRPQERVAAVSAASVNKA